MVLSERYSSEWISQQQTRWKSLCNQKGLPCSGLDSTQKSARARKVSDANALQEWVASVPVLLLLLCKWTSSLRGSSTGRARVILATLVGALITLAPCNTSVYIKDEGDLENAFAAQPGGRYVPIREGRMSVEALALYLGSSRRRFMRHMHMGSHTAR